MKKNKKIIDEAKHIDYDKQGNAVISVGLKLKEDFYEKYCDKSYKLLNSEMLEYIKKSSMTIPATDSLAIDIYTENDISSEDKKQMKDAIKRQYAEELIATKSKLNFNLITALIWAVIGIGVLALGIYFENLKLSSILSNTVMIVAWVFLWEAVDKYFLQRPKIRFEYRLALRFMNSKVSIKKYK